MNAFEQMVFDAAGGLTELTQREYRERVLGEPPDWNLTSQRFACLMIQARAAECRHLAGELLLRVGTREAAGLAAGLTQRSHLLEALAKSWAEKWPPQAGPVLVP